MNETRQYASIINRMTYNFKAEVIVALLLDKGLNFEDIDLILKGSFFRPFRKDIEKATVDSSKRLQLSVSRDGIYDLLPEGICHEQVVETDHKRDIKKLTQIHKKQKKEEEGTRRFFQPLEKEILRLLVTLEQTERDLLVNQRSYFIDFLRNFWGIDCPLTQSQLLFMINTLPYASQLKGNIKATCKILSDFLNKPVRFEKEFMHQELGTAQKRDPYILGRNLILGRSTDPLPLLKIFIDQVAPDDIQAYLPEGQIRQFIFEYLSFYIPITYELKLEFGIEQSRKPSTKGYGVLGFSTSLN